MMPLHPSTWLSYTFAILSGFAFGFVLERAGFGSSRKLAAQFYLRDMTVLKVMFTAIVTAMLGLAVLRAVGVVDWEAVYVNPTNLGPQVVGGLIFGAGFAVGGYCPGTCIVAATTGKLDAFAFLGGTMIFGVQTADKILQALEGLLDGDPILVVVVVGNDFRIFLVVIHPLRISCEHLRQLLFHQLPDIFEHGCLALYFFRKFVAQLLQIDCAHIKKLRIFLIVAR